MVFPNGFLQMFHDVPLKSTKMALGHSGCMWLPPPTFWALTLMAQQWLPWRTWLDSRRMRRMGAMENGHGLGKWTAGVFVLVWLATQTWVLENVPSVFFVGIVMINERIFGCFRRSNAKDSLRLGSLTSHLNNGNAAVDATRCDEIPRFVKKMCKW